MAARFQKVNDPIFGVVDGFDGKVLYQMVPEGGRRMMSVVTDTAEVDLAFDSQTVARFGEKKFSPPTPYPVNDDHAIHLAARTTFEFQIVGERAGNTNLTIRESGGRAVSGLTVSVKKQISRTYSLCRVSDMVRTCPFSEGELQPMMRAVEQTYLQQANVRLNQKGPVFHVLVNDKDLGDPLVPKKILKPENVMVAQHILNKTPTNALGGLILYFVWDLKSLDGTEIVGLNIASACYVEHNSTSQRENALTAAHEIGHALGLGHCGANNLMAGDGVSRNSILQQFEIDTVNRTDERS